MASTSPFKTSRIVELSLLIASNTTKINEYLDSHNIPQPSFDVDGPVDIRFPVGAADVEAARTAVIQDSIELQELLQGPRQLLRPMLNATSLQAIYKYDIAAKIPIHGELSFTRLAELCHLDEPNLRRMVRYAIAYHRIFCEPRKGFVAHSAASRLLVDEADMRQGLGGMFDSTWQAYARTIEALETFKSDEPTATGWNLVHDTQEYHYEHISKTPMEAKRVAGSMKSFATNPDYSPKYLVNAFDWASLGKATVVDIGGCEGHISVALAEEFPLLDFVVQDYAGMIQGATEKLPQRMQERVSFVVHDFLQEQTVEADVYLFRWIFHNWPDKYCIRLLRNLIPALRPGARIIISDAILPEPNTLPLLKERLTRAFDMLMLTLFNSCEREADDWQQLIHRADKRFQIHSMTTPTGSALGVIDIEWRP